MITEIYEHCLAEFPNEACGLIIGGKYYKCSNASPVPTESFVISAAERGELELKHGPVQVIVHSHPHSARPEDLRRPEWPSSHDMTSWIDENIPFWIVACDGSKCDILKLDDTVIPELTGREYIHGYLDCYSVVRDFYRAELGITLRNYPRSFDWWNTGQDLYSANFEKEGFRIKTRRPERGDVILYRFSSAVINHAGVCTGPNMALHHFIDKPSKIYPINKLRSNEALVLEYKGI